MELSKKDIEVLDKFSETDDTDYYHRAIDCITIKKLKQLDPEFVDEIIKHGIDNNMTRGLAEDKNHPYCGWDDFFYA